MKNKHRRFIPQATLLLAPLNDLFKGDKKSSSKPLEWRQCAEEPFHTIKWRLISFIHLTYSVPNIPTALTTDTSEEAMGAIVQEEIDNELAQPLSIASRWNPPNPPTVLVTESSWQCTR